MIAISDLYLKGAIFGALTGGMCGIWWSETSRIRNCIIGMAGGSAGFVALLAISILNPTIGLFCRYAVYGGLHGAICGHRIMRADLTNSIRVGAVFGIFIAAMGLLFGACGVYGSFIGLNLASVAYFSGSFDGTTIQRRLLIPLGL